MKYVKVKYDKEIDKLIDEERKLVFADFEGKRCKKLNEHIKALYLLQIRNEEEK